MNNNQKCNCFWVSSYDLFAFAHKAVFPAPTATSVYRVRKTWSSLWEVICHKRVQQSFLNQSLNPPNQKFLDPPLNRLTVSSGLNAANKRRTQPEECDVYSRITKNLCTTVNLHHPDNYNSILKIYETLGRFSFIPYVTLVPTVASKGHIFPTFFSLLATCYLLLATCELRVSICYIQVRNSIVLSKGAYGYSWINYRRNESW